jgi:hypothetical protein
MSSPTDAVSDAVKKRLADPFLGSLILAVLALHWKFVYALFVADGSVADRLAIAERYPHPVFKSEPRMWLALGSAAFYTFVWPYVAGGIAVFRAEVDRFFTSFNIKREAKKRHETSATLQNRPEWKELSARADALWQLCSQLWSTEAERARAKTGAVLMCVLQHPYSGPLPRLFWREHSSSDVVQPYYGNDCRNDLLLGVRSLGHERLVCVPLNGIISWLWTNAKVGWLRFEHGLPVTESGDPPKHVTTETSHQAMLQIVRLDQHTACYISSREPLPNPLFTPPKD